MNPRLRELAAEAYRQVHPGPDPYGEADATWLGFDKLEKVFAELIVQECADIIDGRDENGNAKDGQYLLTQFGIDAGQRYT